MIITKTPFRISFVGGGTDIIDYYKVDYGAVISATINNIIPTIVFAIFFFMFFLSNYISFDLLSAP